MNTIDSLVGKMTLQEKASLCSGKGFWHTKAVDRLRVPAVMMSDGPHGLRRHPEGEKENGLRKSVPATCFPTGAALASSWDTELMARVGAALAEEAKAQGVAIVLGPAVNIKRSPLCGRNFEYLSEDPLLAGELAAAYIQGMQGLGVGTSLKHYAANNQERNRLLVDVIADERTLREIYLRGFEIAVKKGRPWTVMCAYNRLNGVYCAENRWLLTDVLKRDWGHEGIVVTDWGACDDRVKGLEAGQDLMMPGDDGTSDAEIAAAVQSGALPVEALDEAVKRILRVVFQARERAVSGAAFDAEAHHALAREAASGCAVLLKNDGGFLPLARKGKIAFIGEMARTPRYQGGGSSHVNPTRLDNAHQEALRIAGDAEIRFAAGYSLKDSGGDAALCDEAARLAAWADAAVVFIGLPEAEESQGFDRPDLRVPESHRLLVEAVCAVRPQTVVVLSNGSPVDMPWLSRPRAVLEGYLGGQAGGGAIADILFGDVNPSGKLAETFPMRLSDTPAYLNFPGEKRRVEYREGVFVGYRHYDALGIEPLFPFGHGLSYTSFQYSGISLDRERCRSGEGVTVTLTVKNTGAVAGRETVQLYVGSPAGDRSGPPREGVNRPPKELAAFRKLSLQPGQEKTISFTLDERAFACWDQAAEGWRVEPGTYRILAGSSSRDIRLKASVEMAGAAARLAAWDQNTSISELRGHPVGDRFVAVMEKSFFSQFGVTDPQSVEAKMMRAMTAELPIRNIARMGRGDISAEQLRDLIAAMNGGPQTAALKKLLG